MNKVILVGRLVKDPEVKTTQSQIAVCSFTIAVDRKFKAANGERQSDFISCVAWRQQADLLGKYFEKGSRVGITGNLQSRSYDDASGKKVYVTEVVVDEIEFIDSKNDSSKKEPYSQWQGEQSENNTRKDQGRSASRTRVPVAATPSFDSAFDDDTTLPFDL